MSRPVIPAEAVEAAAKVCLERADGYKWSDFPEDDRAGIRNFVLPLLEAAAPFIEQAAYDEGFGEGHLAGQESMETE